MAKFWTGIKCLINLVWNLKYAKGRYIIASFDGKINYSSKDRTLSSSTTWHESTVVQATISPRDCHSAMYRPESTRYIMPRRQDESLFDGF